MKKLILFFLIIHTYSCTDDINFKSPSISVLGDYEAVSSISNVPIDGDFDGVYSTDLLQEFAKYGPRYIPKVRIGRYSSNDLVTVSCSFNLMNRFPPEYESNTTNVNTRDAGALIYHENGMIFHAYPVQDRDGNDTDTKLLDFEIID